MQTSIINCVVTKLSLCPKKKTGTPTYKNANRKASCLSLMVPISYPKINEQIIIIFVDAAVVVKRGGGEWGGYAKP